MSFPWLLLVTVNLLPARYTLTTKDNILPPWVKRLPPLRWSIFKDVLNDSWSLSLACWTHFFPMILILLFTFSVYFTSQIYVAFSCTNTALPYSVGLPLNTHNATRVPKFIKLCLNSFTAIGSGLSDAFLCLWNLRLFCYWLLYGRF